jgi:hypothetical protein
MHIAVDMPFLRPAKEVPFALQEYFIKENRLNTPAYFLDTSGGRRL